MKKFVVDRVDPCRDWRDDDTGTEYYIELVLVLVFIFIFILSQDFNCSQILVYD